MSEQISSGEIRVGESVRDLATSARSRLPLREYMCYISTKPFDITTATGRAQERHRRAMRATLGSTAAKATSVLAVLLSVSLTFRTLGPSRYGIFVTITSLSAFLSFTDFGIGNGLLNLIADANGREDRQRASECVSTAFFVLLGLAIVVIVGFIAVRQFVPWGKVFKLGSFVSTSEAASTTAVLVICTALSLPLGIVQRIQLAYQEGLRNSVWQIAGSVLTVVLLVIAVKLQAGLVWLSVALLGAPMVATAANYLWHFTRVRPWLLPSPTRFQLGLVGTILGGGLQFFALQIACLLMSAGDNMIAVQLLGPAAVASYAVSQRLFLLPSMLPGMWQQQLWPAYAEALARKDALWVRRTLVRSVEISGGIAASVSFLLLISQNRLFALWVGPSFHSSVSLSIGLAAWAILSTMGSAVAMYLNGSNAIAVQIVPAIVLGATAVLLKLFFCSRFGPAGIAWASVVAYLLASVPIQLVIIRRLLRSQIAEASNAYVST